MGLRGSNSYCEWGKFSGCTFALLKMHYLDHPFFLVRIIRFRHIPIYPQEELHLAADAKNTGGGSSERAWNIRAGGIIIIPRLWLLLLHLDELIQYRNMKPYLIAPIREVSKPTLRMPGI